MGRYERKSFKHILLWKYKTDALPTLLYSKEVCLPQLHKELWYFKFWITCCFFFRFRQQRTVWEESLNEISSEIKQQIHPQPRQKLYTPREGLFSAKVNRIGNFQTQWEIIRCAISWKGLAIVWCIQGYSKVVRCISVFTSLEHISSKRLVVERNGQGKKNVVNPGYYLKHKCVRSLGFLCISDFRHLVSRERLVVLPN